MPQIWLSGSPRGRPSSASRFNMLCVPAPPARPPPPPPSLSQSGTPAPRFKEPAKGTFQAGVMSLDKACVRGEGWLGRWRRWGEWRRREGVRLGWYRAVILDMYITHMQESEHTRGFCANSILTVTHLTTVACMYTLIRTSLPFFFFFLFVEATFFSFV